MINRKIKEFFFNFKMLNHITCCSAKSVFIFEEGLTSNYLQWLFRVLPKGVDLIELKIYPSFFVNKINLSSIEKLQKYEKIFFHSPGEIMQNKSLKMLQSNNFTGLTVGVQHGFIGDNKPQALDKIIRRCKSQYFLSFESEFSKCLQSNKDIKIIEYLYTKPSLSSINEMPEFFECYFDATDKKSIRKDINQINLFLKNNCKKLTRIFFHPSTPSYKKIIIKFILRKHFYPDTNINNNHAICWDSKVKYELINKGKNVYVFNDENSLCKISYSKDINDFDSHVRSSLNDFINK